MAAGDVSNSDDGDPDRSVMLEDFRHESLADASGQLRLLQILPTSKSDPVAVIIDVYDRTTAPPFAALSYTWGNSKLSKQILANGKLLHITETCWYALGQLRIYDTHQFYWVDAICINQTDGAEKSAQVNRMGDVFRDAEYVPVSLGRHTPESVALYEFLAAHQDSLDVSVEDQLCTTADRALDDLLRAIKVFGSRPYWNRLWVVQEFGLARAVVILCGKDKLEWSVLGSFLDKLHAALLKFKVYSKSLSARDASILHDLLMSELDRFRTAIQDSRDGLLSFSELFLQLRARGCRDPRDRIYGLVSLIGNPEKATLKADYSVSPIQLALLTLSCVDQVYIAPIASHLVMALELEANDPRMTDLVRNQAQQLPGQHTLRTTEDVPLSTFNDHVSKVYTIDAKAKRVKIADHWDLLDNDILVPRFARGDDIILRFHNFLMEGTGGQSFASQHEAGLVLRRHNHDRYEVVGHAYHPLGSEDALAYPTYIEPLYMLLWVWQLQHEHVLELWDYSFKKEAVRRGRMTIDDIMLSPTRGL